MGLSLKKIGKTISNAVKDPGEVLKKAAVVVEGTAVGFATTGNPLGAIAGGTSAAIKASKTHEAPALNLRTAYQTGFLAMGSAVAAQGAASLISKAPSAVSSLKSSGGLLGKATTALKSTGSALAKAKSGGSLLSSVTGLFKKGTAESATPDTEATADAPAPTAPSLAGNAMSQVNGMLDKFTGKLKKGMNKNLEAIGVNTGDAAPAAPNPLVSQMGMAGDISSMFIPALIIGGIFLLTGRKGK